MKKSNQNIEIAIYQAPNGAIELQKSCDSNEVWANMNQISKLFERDKSVISKHIKNIFKEKELIKEEVVAIFATTSKHGAIKGKTKI